MQGKSRNILIVFFVLAIVATVAITLFATREKEGTEDLYGVAMAKLSQTNTASLRLELDTFVSSAGLTGGDGGLLGAIDIPLGVSGPVSLSYPAGGVVSGQSELDFSAGLGLMQLMKLNTVLAKDGQLYAKVQDMPDDLGLSVDVSSLNDAWFSLSGRDLSQLMPWLDSSDSTPEFGQAAPVSADMLRSSIGGWLVPQRRYQDTIIAGQAAAHYDLLVDRAGLAKFLTDLTGALRGRLCSVQEKAAIAEHVDAQRLLAEAWVSQASGNLLLLKLGVFPEGDGAGMPVALTLAFSEFDQPVTLEIPADAVPLSTVLTRFMTGSAAQ